MKYLLLSMDKEITNPMVMEQYDDRYYRNDASKELFDEAMYLQVCYYHNSLDLEKPDVFELPSFLVSERLKRLLLNYEPNLPFKGLQCCPYEETDMESPSYWHPYLEKVSCLDEQSERYPNGLLKQLVLKKAPIQGKHIFTIESTLEYPIVVSLELAESMLRRYLWGITLTPIEIAAA